MKKEIHSENEIDERLLREKPGELVVKYQGIIKIIVKKFISSKMFQSDDFDDVVQQVNEDILRKVHLIQRGYNGTALLKTYFSAIVRNSCLKIREKKQKTAMMVPLEETHVLETEDFLDEFEIEYALKRLERVLTYFDRKRGKVVLCTKLYFQIPIDRGDIVGCFPRCSENDTAFMLEAFEPREVEMTAKEIYHIITPILNKYEEKENTDDAVRRWTEDRIQEVLSVLNTPPNGSNFNKESLKILMEKYFSKRPVVPDTYR